jgi:hypothetical protein
MDRERGRASEVPEELLPGEAALADDLQERAPVQLGMEGHHDPARPRSLLADEDDVAAALAASLEARSL